MCVMTKDQAIQYYIALYKNTGNEFYCDEALRIIDLELKIVYVLLD